MLRQVCIRTDELPPRARLLAPAEVSKIFGGCILGFIGFYKGQQCAQDSDCCAGLHCKSGGFEYGASVGSFDSPMVCQ